MKCESRNETRGNVAKSARARSVYTQNNAKFVWMLKNPPPWWTVSWWTVRGLWHRNVFLIESLFLQNNIILNFVTCNGVVILNSKLLCRPIRYLIKEFLFVRIRKKPNEFQHSFRSNSDFSQLYAAQLSELVTRALSIQFSCESCGGFARVRCQKFYFESSWSAFKNVNPL